MKFGTAIILAGGKSLRMGFDKQSIRVDDRLLVREIAVSLLKDFPEIIVVTHSPGYYQGLPIRVTGDLLPSQGPMSGIHAGLTLASSEYSFILACDMPHYCREYAMRMKDELQENSAGILTALEGGRVEPFHAFYHKRLAGPIAEGLQAGVRRIRVIAEEQNMQFLPVRVAKEYCEDLSMFRNLNTEEDLEDFLQGRKAGDW